MAWCESISPVRPPVDAAGQYVSYSAFVDLDRSNLSEVIGVASEPYS
jgi:hypothetical protein